MELEDSGMKNLILQSTFFLVFQIFQGCDLTFKKRERVVIMINVTSIRVTLAAMLRRTPTVPSMY